VRRFVVILNPNSRRSRPHPLLVPECRTHRQRQVFTTLRLNGRVTKGSVLLHLLLSLGTNQVSEPEIPLKLGNPPDGFPRSIVTRSS